jgi:hypothetical protein
MRLVYVSKNLNSPSIEVIVQLSASGVITSCLKYVSEIFILHIRKVLINRVHAPWRANPLIPLMIFPA